MPTTVDKKMKEEGVEKKPIASEIPLKKSDCLMIIVKRSVFLLGQTKEQEICASRETQPPPVKVLFKVTWLSLQSLADSLFKYHSIVFHKTEGLKGRKDEWLMKRRYLTVSIVLPHIKRCLVGIKVTSHN